MSPEWIVFVTASSTSFIVFQIMWDGQFITYQIFRWLHERDDPAFVEIHGKYVASLGLATYFPILVYLFSCGLLLWFRPEGVPLAFPVALNSLNLLATLSTFTQLVPIHIRIDRDGQATDQQVNRLLRFNTVRFALMGVNCALVVALLSHLLTD